ncbi:unnamed protein product, partial [Prorocentrum cordatum]
GGGGLYRRRRPGAREVGAAAGERADAGRAAALPGAAGAQDVVRGAAPGVARDGEAGSAGAAPARPASPGRRRRPEAPLRAAAARGLPAPPGRASGGGGGGRGRRPHAVPAPAPGLGGGTPRAPRAAAALRRDAPERRVGRMTAEIRGEPTGGAPLCLRREVEVPPFVVCLVLARGGAEKMARCGSVASQWGPDCWGG